ncbi:MAG: 1-(5-phosphoribosyl)-5-[(5-phosphoribosylamino)methylideneamino]imidazole-4-carboxamide isomerase [Clostridia bacterium]|nr:1-(5-phosphoribosyl)-5-[(5-phosphoribosylamino)methylideneamino]imidazole-4-carboxamide isomerase [Clostridia bacterium]
MKYYPAIDIYNGQGVRLLKGDFNKVKVYGDPLTLIDKFIENGATDLHVVDLNGAKQMGDNQNLILELLKKKINIQIGGGIRNLSIAESYLKNGAKTIVLGTAAIKDFEMVKTLNQKYPNQIAIALDARKGELSVEGWLEQVNLSMDVLLTQLMAIGLKRIIYTDILRDGMLSGPNFKMYEKLVKRKGLEVVASGGISSSEDVKQLEQIGVFGMIVGKALYENHIKLVGGILC